ncbi:MAG: hypothetical protein JHC95_18410 [Solirubrobacteraceae bacterium]|nr:hypothetical protein [Solirubrobacteraceae bacterium]
MRSVLVAVLLLLGLAVPAVAQQTFPPNHLRFFADPGAERALISAETSAGSLVTLRVRAVADGAIRPPEARRRGTIVGTISLNVGKRQKLRAGANGLLLHSGDLRVRVVDGELRIRGIPRKTRSVELELSAGIVTRASCPAEPTFSATASRRGADSATTESSTRCF